jgi:GT2 family glycosyltransferase
MKALIGMAVYSTDTNKKDECLKRTLQSLLDTGAFKHQVVLSVNAKTLATEGLIYGYRNLLHDVIYNETNIGTAEAINKVWKNREPGQHCIKMDDDVVIHNSDWVDMLISCIERDPNIGIIGLKRKDCWEKPSNPNPDYKSELIMLDQKPGEKWLIVERAKHIIGTCQMYNSALLDKMGYLYQPSLYGYDDVLASWRSQVGGFKNVFLPHVEIDHIDDGKTEYQDWKHRHSGEQTQNVIRIVNEYIQGVKPIYYNPYD